MSRRQHPGAACAAALALVTALATAAPASGATGAARAAPPASSPATVAPAPASPAHPPAPVTAAQAATPAAEGTQPQAPQHPDPPDPLRAIGEITYLPPRPGNAICTGTLVAPDLVLTAGHCLRRHGSGAAMDPAAIRFAPAWPDASPRPRTGREIVLPPGTDWRQDVALLVLDAPVPADSATPLPLAATEPAGPLAFIGYDRAAPDRAGRRDCALLGTEGAALALGCDAVSGNSGAPLLQPTATGWQIAGVMVARTRGAGPIRAFAIRPDQAVRARIAGN